MKPGRPKKEDSLSEYDSILKKIRELEDNQEKLGKQIQIYTAKRDQLERLLCE